MVGISHVSTMISLKRKSLINLLLRFSLYISAHCLLELPINSNYQPWDNWGSLQKVSPDKPFIISHSREDNPIFSSSQKGHRLTSKFILLDLSPSISPAPTIRALPTSGNWVLLNSNLFLLKPTLEMFNMPQAIL